MPGIAGVISRQPAHICERMTAQMIASMQHEKFHVSGSYSAPELGVFVGWVALEDSFADCQPILSERGDVVLLLSGECFSDPDVHVTPGQIDSAETIATRVRKAAEFLAPERITLNPDCGFAPGSGAVVSIDEAYRKLCNEAEAARILRAEFGR